MFDHRGSQCAVEIRQSFCDGGSIADKRIIKIRVIITLVDKISLTKFSRRLINIFRIIFECWIRKKYSFSKVYSISPNSQVFPRNQPFSAVFAIKNIRKRDRVVLIFLNWKNVILRSYCKRKNQKKLKIGLLPQF